MLNKHLTAIFLSIIAGLCIVVICMLLRINSLDNSLSKTQKQLIEKQLVIAKQTTQLNSKLVEVVYSPNVEYVEKKIYEKPTIEYVTKEAIKIVDRPVYSNTCLDDDGLQLIKKLTDPSPTNNTSTTN